MTTFKAEIANESKYTLGNPPEGWSLQKETAKYLCKVDKSGDFLVRIHLDSGEVYITNLKLLKNISVNVTPIKELTFKVTL